MDDGGQEMCVIMFDASQQVLLLLDGFAFIFTLYFYLHFTLCFPGIFNIYLSLLH